MSICSLSSGTGLTLLTFAFAGVLSSCAHKEKITAVPAVEVTAMRVSGSDSQSSTVYSGTVESGTTTPVASRVPGTVEAVLVEEGQQVRAGQTIARLQTGTLTNAYNIAQSELAQARDAYARLKKLHDADALPDIKWVEMQQKLKQAENAADIAHRELSDATITAPVSGIVSRKLVSAGQTIIMAEPIVEIVDVNGLKMSVSVPESTIGSIAEGSTAPVSFPTLDSITVEGRNAIKSVVADPFTRSYTVKYDIDNASGRILPGMTGTVSIASAPTKGSTVIVLPPQAVLLGDDNKYFVWTIADGRAERRIVDVAGQSKDGITVTSGLNPADSVIVAGMQKVSTGTKVIAVH